MFLECTRESEYSQKIKHKIYETAVLGRNVTIFCNLTSLANVLQVTWQKMQGSLPQNIGTYSHRFGENILPPYVNRLHCNILEPNASFITIQKVTFEDEACYKCLFNSFPHGSHGGQTCLNISTLSELATEFQSVPGSEDLINLYCSAVGKPAPGISIYPSQALELTQYEYFTKNLNSTVTVSKIYNISLKTVRSLNLRYLVVSMTHPLRNVEKIVPLPGNPEGTNDHCLNWMITTIVFIILFFNSCVINVVLYIYFSKKRSENVPVSLPTQIPTPSTTEGLSYLFGVLIIAGEDDETWTSYRFSSFSHKKEIKGGSINYREGKSSQRIKLNNYETAVLGKNVTIFCNLTSLANVEQITWQKMQGSLLQNTCTYSHRYGENILPPYVNRLHCNILEPSASFITIQKVTFEDEACYKCLFNSFLHGSHGGQTCLNISTLSELATEFHSVPGSEDLINLYCSAVGKPAPGISIYPSQALKLTQYEYFTKNLNTTVTVSKLYNISLKSARSLNLRYLVVSMTHPLRNVEKIVPLPVNPEGAMNCSENWKKTAVVFIILFISFIIFGTILYTNFKLKRSKNTREKSSTQIANETSTLVSTPPSTEIET
ncbi:OX-2 membrane glycoprotein-like [Sigmodon hispidus]